MYGIVVYLKLIQHCMLITILEFKKQKTGKKERKTIVKSHLLYEPWVNVLNFENKNLLKQ